MVDDQLGGHNGVDQGRVPTLGGNGITQAGEVDERGLAQNVVTDHARGKPGEIAVAPAFYQLQKRFAQYGRITASHEVFGVHARCVRQGVVSAGLDFLDSRTGVEVVEI